MSASAIAERAWGWRASAVPPAPQAAVGWGDIARRLHARLSLADAALAGALQATANRDVLVVIGAPADLPWVEGVEYAAPHPEAPQLWVPTLVQPDIPCDLLARALTRAHARQPLLVWPRPACVVPLDRALPLSAALLSRIAVHWRGA
ncbi:bpX5 domain-containing protein [Ralstonia pseudosolanacearum]|uniref:bpX5 domain-containing protein n=1 Tax=Ralstonia pseudosolanacearum TaxID=1310165 RepID=UPI002E21668D